MVPVQVPTFEKLWFRFRFLLLKSHGSGSGSGSGSSSISRPYKENKIFKNFWKKLVFLLSKLFYKEKVYIFQQICGKM
jgi:hypothetical protein